MDVFCAPIEEKVKPNDHVMEGVTLRPIHTKDLRAAGAFREVGNMVFGKLLTQVKADRIERGYVIHVPLVGPSRHFCSMRDGIGSHGGA